ncbi:MAG: PIG-L family deacetylase [Oscillospiraceae bacterium]|nr:PIG-L family deacetylase [Oscillospiraceae bacterium]
MRKKIVRLLIVSLLCCGLLLSGGPAAAEGEDTAALTSEASALRYKLSGLKGSTKALSDGKQGNYVKVPAGAELTLTALEKIFSLYILWDAAPLGWELTAEGETVECGNLGRRHEYVALPQPSETVTIRLSDKGSIRINEIYAFGEGDPPDWVQVWDSPCRRADILVIPTHADDEFIFFGGLLPYYAGELGLQVQVMYMTNHQLSERVRNHELLNGLWTAGVRHYPVINNALDLFFEDRDAAEVSYYDAFLRAQVRSIRRFQPLVIVGHAVNGEYGHQAHIQNALCLQEAVKLASDPEYDPDSARRYGLWDTPKVYLHLFGAEKDRTVLDYETPLEAFGGKTAFEVAREAYRCHTSQHKYNFQVYGFGSPYDSHSFGLYRSLVGPDVRKNDLMENIDPARWRGESNG